jgi:AbrB family looped-hinge helix DNA binding protein
MPGAVATVTAKGQVTVPVEVRKRLDITAGTKLEFVITEDGRLEVIPRSGSVRDLKGMLPAPSPPLSLEDMDRAIAEGVAS